MEHGLRDLGLDRLEDRHLDRPGGVIERHEDDPLTAPDRRRLRSDLDPRDHHPGILTARNGRSARAARIDRISASLIPWTSWRARRMANLWSGLGSRCADGADEDEREGRESRVVDAARAPAGSSDVAVSPAPTAQRE